MGIRSFRRAMRQPSRSRWPAAMAWVVIGVATVLFIGVVVARLQRHDSLTQWRQSLERAAGPVEWPAWSPNWPALPTPSRKGLAQDLHGPYAYAARAREVLGRIPCYCGCVGQGHGSVLNCFVREFRENGTPVWNDHSFDCDLCVHIAREVMLMSVQGMSVSRIREEIDGHYRAIGQPTRTPISSHAVGEQ